MNEDRPTLRDLRNQDFRYQDLTDMDLSNCDLTGSKFDGSTGRRLNVSGSVLTDTSWRGAEQIEMNGEGMIAEGILDQSCLMAPGLKAQGARVVRWILTSAEVPDCRLQGAVIGTLVGGALDMTGGETDGWQVEVIEGEHNRLPRSTR